MSRLAWYLLVRGVKKGDIVTTYMSMIPEAIYAMLACARIGAVHSVVFAGFSSIALRDRILDANSTVIITANEGIRGGKIIPLKCIMDEALEGGCGQVSTVLTFKRTDGDVPWTPERDQWWDGLEPETLDLAPRPKLSELSPEERSEAVREYTVQNVFIGWRKLMHAKNPDLYRVVDFQKTPAYGLIFLAYCMFEYGEAHF